MSLRHEYKFIITEFDALELFNRLSLIMKIDEHATEGFYKIRSLYFDDIFDTALKENLSGVKLREKFRLRIYNEDNTLILLEKKSKINGLCKKEQIKISKSEALNLIFGNTEKIEVKNRKLLEEIILKIKCKCLKPKTIIDYKREPFILNEGNVRVTIDYDIKSSRQVTEFFNFDLPTIPIKNSPVILEVKWDEFLPSIVTDIIQLNGINRTAFSKYANSRMLE